MVIPEPYPYSLACRSLHQTAVSIRIFSGVGQLEAAFCYYCRHFCNRIDTHFTVTGFCNWQHALEKKKGLSKYAASIVYMQAMAAWKEMDTRASTKQENAV